VVVIEHGRIARAVVALGSVAQKPWRLHAAEPRLVGQPPTRDAVFPILTAAVADARPLAHNRYKVAMAAGAATRAIMEAAA
jgi:xanthine dehydrogenase YagS FAD-binding subunit